MNIDVLKSIDFKRLQIFLTVTDCQGFSPAQDKLGISSSSISLHMSELEKKLGIVLCKRGNSGFSLTPEGREIYKASQSLLLAHAEFNSIVGETKGMLEGELNIGFIDQLVFDDGLDIPGFLDEVHQLAPQLKETLFSMSPSELTNAMITQNLHFGVGVFYDRSPLINYQEICVEKLTLYCGKKHRLFNECDGDVSLSDIQNERFVERTFRETLPICNTPFR
jgi:DNA-binding transcriptional LysR family regulator